MSADKVLMELVDVDSGCDGDVHQVEYRYDPPDKALASSLAGVPGTQKLVNDANGGAIPNAIQFVGLSDLPIGMVREVTPKAKFGTDLELIRKMKPAVTRWYTAQ